jgi:hypothetical protein
MVLLIPGSLSAQTVVPSNSLKGQLLELGVRGADPFVPEQVAALANLVGLEVSTAPIGTSSGGFTFTFDSQLGTFRRLTGSFGPAFGERSLTIGKGKFGAGFNWLHAGYNSLAGSNLRNGELRTSQNVQIVGSPMSYATIQSDLSSDTIVGFASFGLTENLEVAVAVPWIRISLDADVAAFDSSGVKLGQLHLPQTSSSGLGDLAIVSKYHVWHQGGGGLSAALEVRVPTGATNGLRGLGVTRTLVSAIWSQGGKISPHANVGYEVWSAAVPISPTRRVFAKHQIKYAAGIEITPHSRATVLLDLVGRRLVNGGALGYETFVVPGVGSSQQLVGLSRSLDVVSLAPGIKWNVARNVLITGNVLGSLRNDGLRANFIPTIGMDWAF